MSDMDEQPAAELYRVVWDEPAALACLNAWNALLPHHSLAVTRAENVINILLKHAPLRYADPLTEGLLKLEVKPLIAYFEIEPAHVVRIKAVRLVPAKDQPQNV
ncbi:hypothetical protein R5W24_005814 [Gemmata sp. JC717]|uniref:hypothetical protein n=1 Tax=Gemmata algarum TaxID=2975278 RepID=UPI0021BB6B7C|nr:hypothetical protein [Gemmata algarum]MDY3556645.1 hypothetical protein [Gemmata algarum]